MFPLRDDNPTAIVPVVTIILITINVAVFLYQLSLGPRAGELFIYQYGSIPAVVLGEKSLPRAVTAIPSTLTLFTSMFLHGGWMHLIGNMWYLWIFGDNIEEAMGRVRYIIFYLLAGLAASISQILSNVASVLPSIGASGAIAGVLGAYLLLYPRARVETLIFLGIFIRIISVPAGFILGFWFLLQLWSGSMSGGQDAGGVAFWAHIGGFAAGMILVPLFKRANVRLFSPPRGRAETFEGW